MAIELQNGATGLLDGMQLDGTNGAAHVAFIDPSTGSALGVLNGGVKVADVYAPARDIFQMWFHGGDAVSALETLTVNVANNGLWQDMSLIGPSMRQIVIINGSSGGAVDYSFIVRFSRNGLGSATDDMYTAKTVAAGAKAQIVGTPLPATDGYDRFCQVVITPTAGQAGAQLTFKAYLTGRGG